MVEVVLREFDLQCLDEVLRGPVEHDRSAPLPRSILLAVQGLIPCDWLAVWELQVGTSLQLRTLELPEGKAVPTPCADGALEVELPAAVGTTASLRLHRVDRCFSARDRLVLELLRPRLAEVYLAGLAGSGQGHLLTARERRVLSRVAAGCSSQQIAEELGVAVSTVRKHLENCYVKLGVRSRSAAVAAAYPQVLASISSEG